MATETPSGMGERDGEHERDGGGELTRERLDGAPVTGWRGALAGWAERAGVWPGADPERASAELAGPSRVARASGGAGGAARRLTARQKLARVAVIALAAMLALGVGLDGFSAAGRAVTAFLFPPKPTPVLSTTPYTLRNLPPLAQHLPHIALAPLASGDSDAYACWVNPYDIAASVSVGQVIVERTANAGASWSPVAIPAISALDCSIITDGASGSGALLIADPYAIASGVCQPPALFYHPGSYGGVVSGNGWSPVPWPVPDIVTACDAQLALEDGAIYAWSAETLLAGDQPFGASGRLIVTRDRGATWAAADAGLNDTSGLSLVGFRPAGRILATVPDVSGPPAASLLMESSDYGASWRSLGDLPGAFPTVYVSTDPAQRLDWGRLYVLSRPLEGGAPANMFSLMLATAAHLGAKWTAVPLPPLITGDPPATEASLPSVLGVGPAQSLIAQRGVIPSNDHGQLTPAYWLWAWSVSQNRWLRDTEPGPGNVDTMVWSWSHGSQTWWLTSLKLGVPPTLALFTKTYPASALS